MSWVMRNWEEFQRTFEEVFKEIPGITPGKLEERVAHIEQIIKDAGLDIERIRKNLRKIGEKLQDKVAGIQQEYDNYRERVSEKLSDIVTTSRIIGPETQENTILWKMNKYTKNLVNDIKDLYDNLGVLADKIKRFVQLFKDAWYVVGIGDIKIYVPKINILMASIDEIYKSLRYIWNIMGRLDQTKNDATELVNSARELAAATARIAKDVVDVSIMTADFLRATAESLASVFEEVHLASLTIRLPETIAKYQFLGLTKIV